MLAAICWLLACQQEPTAAACCAPVRVTLSASGFSLVVGENVQLLGWTVDTKGRVATAAPDWKSADLAIATVGREGLVTAVSPGTTTLTATVGTLSATATVSVLPWATPVALVISPSTLTMVAGSVGRLSAVALDSVGRRTGATIEWSSADPIIATIGQADGVVTAIADGSTTITAAAGALRATMQVVVSTPAFAFSFTRTTSLGQGQYRSEVLSYSNGSITSLLQPAQFSSIAAPAWSPNGLQLAVEVIHTFVDTGEWLEYNSDLYVVDATAPVGSSWRALTTSGLSTSPTWSPDGRRIAYVEKTALYGNTNIRIADAAGGGPVTLSLPPGWYGKPCWSPDGSRLAFSGQFAGGNNSVIFVVNVDGSGLKALTTPTSDYDPCWSPSGTQLVFVRLRREPSGAISTDLSTRDLDDGNVVRLFSSTSFISLPVWSADRRQIIFSSAGALYAINAEGSAMVRLTNPPPNAWDSAPAWKR